MELVTYNWVNGKHTVVCVLFGAPGLSKMEIYQYGLFFLLKSSENGDQENSGIVRHCLLMEPKLPKKDDSIFP